jgi:hypothetical protein
MGKQGTGEMREKAKEGKSLKAAPMFFLGKKQHRRAG